MAIIDRLFRIGTKMIPLGNKHKPTGNATQIMTLMVSMIVINVIAVAQ